MASPSPNPTLRNGRRRLSGTNSTGARPSDRCRYRADRGLGQQSRQPPRRLPRAAVERSRAAAGARACIHRGGHPVGMTLRPGRRVGLLTGRGGRCIYRRGYDHRGSAPNPPARRQVRRSSARHSGRFRGRRGRTVPHYRRRHVGPQAFLYRPVQGWSVTSRAVALRAASAFLFLLEDARRRTRPRGTVEARIRGFLNETSGRWTRGISRAASPIVPGWRVIHGEVSWRSRTSSDRPMFLASR